ncbi:hypothetical protein PR202_gb17211 [Eleusine coracana subsp. coracana]|uniref:Uncharacterized protein n=1 Tax=Eleusine coracana subsp. coracana TaxID=191504 RepID=A0AAV5F006_ELECO|nr:hypothetical protein QOZ80_6BG0469050 [Eleusine coracana subsp. coracana]GJN29024.1 hypothetical protein PR202_gb17211 [Eleusine coracana subsp. coracana]
MTVGDGETSYAKNSRLQEKVIVKVRPILEKATIQAYKAILPKTMVIADLGCSSGPNTLLFISTIINTIAAETNKQHGGCDQVELQFFLNDLPGNDFNLLFRSLEPFKKSIATDQDGQILPPYYISGLPGSFYTRLFPNQTVHLFHSACCLHWRSQVPEGLQSQGGAYLNEGNIYISTDSSPLVVKMFQEQFYGDFSLFLKLRHDELVSGGQMVLTFLSRKNEDVFSGDLNYLLGLLAQSLKTLVAEGLVEKEMLDSFNVPMYAPSAGEVKQIVKESELFDLEHIQLGEANWDPFDDSIDDLVHDSTQSGVNVAKYCRAFTEPLIASHFGEAILDTLFAEFGRRVGEHLEKEKTKHVAILVFLKKK